MKLVDITIKNKAGVKMVSVITDASGSSRLVEIFKGIIPEDISELGSIEVSLRDKKRLSEIFLKDETTSKLNDNLKKQQGRRGYLMLLPPPK